MPMGNKKAHHSSRKEHQKSGRGFSISIHEERALTLLILSNLGMGFNATLSPERSIRMAYPVAILPLMRVLMAQVAHFVELAKAADLPCWYPLLTVFAFGLLIVPVGDTSLGEYTGRAKDGGCSPHLRGMKQWAFFRTLVLEGDGLRMQCIVTGLAQGQQIRFPTAPLLTSENQMMHLQASILRFSSTVLAHVPVPREHIGFGVGKPIVNPLLVEPLVVQDFWVFQGVRIKGPRFQYDGANGQQ